MKCTADWREEFRLLLLSHFSKADLWHLFSYLLLFFLHVYYISMWNVLFSRMKLKEVDRTAMQAWSPAQNHPIYLATGKLNREKTVWVTWFLLFHIWLIYTCPLRFRSSFSSSRKPLLSWWDRCKLPVGWVQWPSHMLVQHGVNHGLLHL